MCYVVTPKLDHWHMNSMAKPQSRSRKVSSGSSVRLEKLFVLLPLTLELTGRKQVERTLTVTNYSTVEQKFAVESDLPCADGAPFIVVGSGPCESFM